MEEGAAQAVALVRAFEEADPAGRLLHPDDRRTATEAARTAATSERQAAERARPLLAILEREVPGLARARALSRVGLGITAGASLAALIAGLLSDALGPSREISLLSFPLLGLLAWNLGVYLALALRAAGAIRAPASTREAARTLALEATAKRWRGSLEAVLAWLAEWALERARPRTAQQSEVVARALAAYWREWAPAHAPVAAARIRLALHAGAAFLAIGTVLGMYLRGLALAYHVSWESTFLGADTVATILRVVLAPAAALTGGTLPDAADLEQIQTSTGQSAAAWIHLWAVTAALVVVLPRLALGLRELARQARLARDVPIEPLRGPFRALLAPDRGAETQVAVLPYSLRLEPRAVDLLSELLHEVFGLRAGVRVIDSLPYGASADGLAGSATNSVVVVVPAVQSPEREVHGRFLADLRDGGVRHLLVVVDTSAWGGRRGAAADERRRAERRRAWDRVLRESGVPSLHLDLSAPLPEDAVSRAEECLRAAEVR